MLLPPATQWALVGRTGAGGEPPSPLLSCGDRGQERSSAAVGEEANPVSPQPGVRSDPGGGGGWGSRGSGQREGESLGGLQTGPRLGVSREPSKVVAGGRDWLELEGGWNGVDVTPTDGKEETQDPGGRAHGTCWLSKKAVRGRRLWKRRLGMRPEKDGRTGR